jgi:hypothetical protein
MRLVKFTMPTGEANYIAVDAVVQVHEVFRSDHWAEGACTAIIFGYGLKIGVREDLQTVLERLNA